MNSTATAEVRLAALTDPEVREEQGLEERTLTDTPWNLVVWNDPVNLMSYVSYVFRSYFGYSQKKADRLMMEVHRKGRSIVAHGGRERMEQHVVAMHGFGLWATVERAGAGGKGQHG